MAAMAVFRIGFAVRFWRKLRILAFAYVGLILVLAIVELVFHVRL
jgi:hypothetical protein